VFNGEREEHLEKKSWGDLPAAKQRVENRSIVDLSGREACAGLQWDFSGRMGGFARESMGNRTRHRKTRGRKLGAMGEQPSKVGKITNKGGRVCQGRKRGKKKKYYAKRRKVRRWGGRWARNLGGTEREYREREGDMKGGVNRSGRKPVFGKRGRRQKRPRR